MQNMRCLSLKAKRECDEQDEKGSSTSHQQALVVLLQPQASQKRDESSRFKSKTRLGNKSPTFLAYIHEGRTARTTKEQ
jgi:hypothetical protein